MTKQQLINFVEDEFNIKPDYPFDNDFDSAVFRHKTNKKWFGLVMKVKRNKIIGDDDRVVDVLNLKCDTMIREPLLKNKGIYVAYHMNKIHWISVILEEIELEEVIPLIEMSYDLTSNLSKK